jgi:hypothetical protein
MTPAQVARDLTITAIDLTRACSEHELYVIWLRNWTPALNGSAGIANYLFLAAMAFEEQAHPQLPTAADVFEAREILADILMASAPLSSDELRQAVKLSMDEASEDTPNVDRPDQCPDGANQNGRSIHTPVPATHSKFERGVTL